MINRRDMIKGALASAILPSVISADKDQPVEPKKQSTIATHLRTGVMISGAHVITAYVDACDINGNVISRVKETGYRCELIDGQVVWDEVK